MVHRTIVGGVAKPAPGGISGAKAVDAIGVIDDGDGFAVCQNWWLSVVWRNFVAQPALLLRFSGLHLFAQGFDLERQEVNLLLLAKDCAIEFINHVVGKADLYFEIGQA